jgi:hypothetical protein
MWSLWGPQADICFEGHLDAQWVGGSVRRVSDVRDLALSFNI